MAGKRQRPRITLRFLVTECPSNDGHLRTDILSLACELFSDFGWAPILPFVCQSLGDLAISVRHGSLRDRRLI